MTDIEGGKRQILTETEGERDSDRDFPMKLAVGCGFAGVADCLPAELHPFIAERVEDFRQGTIGSGEYVLYWMRTALRTHENPALDIARHEARRRGLPLLVCAFMLTEAHPHPTLRRMKFFLEGLRDVQLELKAQVCHNPDLDGVLLLILPSL